MVIKPDKSNMSGFDLNARKIKGKRLCVCDVCVGAFAYVCARVYASVRPLIIQLLEFMGYDLHVAPSFSLLFRPN